MWKSALRRMESVFPANILRLGHASQLQGHVLNLRLSDGLIKARVKGRTNQIFTVFFDLKDWPTTASKCNCQVQKNCEHAAACLFALEAGAINNNPTPLENNDISQVEEVIRYDEVEWYSDVDAPKNDFFAYHLGIVINGQKVNIIPIVADLIHRWDAKTLAELSDSLEIKLPIGKAKNLVVTLGRIKPLLTLLLNLNTYKKADSEKVSLESYELLLVMEAEEAIKASAARWYGTEKIKTTLRQLIDAASLEEVTIPKGLKTDLRDYQRHGLKWLQSLSHNKFGGILADDMGLGKTVQTLAHLMLEKENGRLQSPCLIISPTSLVGNWYDEILKFTPDLKPLIYHGTHRQKKGFANYDIVISTYGLLQRDKKKFLNTDFYYIILDEAQCIKNSRTKTTKIVQQLKGKHRLCLSGTPLENHLGELWSLFHFLMPGFLGDAKSFKKNFKKPIESNKDKDKLELLNKRISPFLLRRRKDDVLQELPLKTETVQYIEIENEQRDLYEAIRLSMEKRVRDAIKDQGLNKSQILLLDALLKLRQVCCDPRLLNLPGAEMAHGSSAKLEALVTLLQNLVEEGRRVLVFSQFTSMLKLIEEELNKLNYDYLKLTGKSTNRTEIVRTFQEGEVPIFLISLKAGGVGLNLTQSDTVIHYDPWWNPAVENQATDRSHRIGQQNPVFVYKLITKGTVEETIVKMQQSKRDLVDSILADTELGNMRFSEEDIENLFGSIS